MEKFFYITGALWWESTSQAIIWNKADVLLIAQLETSFDREI